MRERRRESIAIDGSPTGQYREDIQDIQKSFLFPLSRELSQHLLCFLYIIESQFAGFDEMRHHRLAPAAQQAEQLVDQPALRSFARNRRLEDVRVTDPLHAAHGLLS